MVVLATQAEAACAVLGGCAPDRLFAHHRCPPSHWETADDAAAQGERGWLAADIGHLLR